MSSRRRPAPRRTTPSRPVHTRAAPRGGRSPEGDGVLSAPSPPPPPPPPAEASTGQRLADRYVLGDLLGEGGAALVFRAHDQILDREVVVKVLRDAVLSSGRRRAVLRAAQASERVRHRNLVPILDVNGGRPPFLVLSPVEGGRLADLDLPLPAERARTLVTGLLSGLAALHDAGLVHRDVTAENVLLDGSGAALLTGAGLTEAAADPTLGAAEGLDGVERRPPSPQQELGLAPDQRADVYAAAQLVRGLLPGTSPAVDAVLERALLEDPDERFPDAVALQQALREPLAGPLEPRAATAPSAPEQGATAAVAQPAPARHRRTAAIAAVAVLAVIVALVTFAGRPEPVALPEPEPPAAAAPAEQAPRPAQAPALSPLAALIVDGERDPSALGAGGAQLLDRLRRLQGLTGEQRAGEVAGLYGATVVGAARGGVDPTFAQRILAALRPELDTDALLAHVAANPEAAGRQGPSYLGALRDLQSRPPASADALGAELGLVAERWTREGMLSPSVGIASVAALRGIDAGTAPTADVSISVAAADGFVDTGIDLAPGATVIVSALGEVSSEGESAGPEGLPATVDRRARNLLRDAGHAGLLARVGPDGELFAAGDGQPFPVAVGGRLYLGLNDLELDDNSGSFDVRVAVFS